MSGWQVGRVVAVLVVGGVLTLALAAATAMSTADAVKLDAIVAGVTLGGFTAGAVALHVLRRRRVGTQAVALALTTLLALVVGAYAAARSMFISHHDLTVLVVVLAAAGTVGVASALVLGTRVGAATDALVDVARRIAQPTEGTHTGFATPARSEFTRLADELAAMERRLDHAREREAALDTSRRELVAWVSHDLRTPLAGMRAIVEALQDGIVADDETRARYVQTLGQEVNNLSVLVDDLFELSRTQSGSLRLHYERVSLYDLVSDVLAGSAPVAAAKGVHLEGRIVGPSPELAVSPPEVVRALRNVLENAIRHTPSDGSVVVEAGIDDDEPACVYVAVHDTGGGVPPGDLPRIFEVAFQSDRARTPGGGSGLGLAIAKGFVEAHQGELVVCNENGGARFTMRLPREPG